MKKTAGIVTAKIKDGVIMIRLISFLITGCWHQWKIIDTISVFERGYNDREIATRFVLQCTKCGDVKKREIS